MATSPSHKFGQDLGNLLEDVVLNRILKPRLQAFARAKNYYLDWQKDRPARSGKKVCWEDKYGNKHDLDFVIEVGGTDQKIGRPVAFIEAAWRRYTKHSKNKAQEIQGALLPIIEMHHLSAPFFGVVLAGEFTEPALTQLRNNRFSVIYIRYQDVVAAFAAVGFNIAFDENTRDAKYAAATRKLASLTKKDKDIIRQTLTTISKVETDTFMSTLQAALERLITKITILPLFGTRLEFGAVKEALAKLGEIDLKTPAGHFDKFEVIIDYNNGDTIRASFKDKTGLSDFLNMLDS